jgi:hypothetical protein
MSTIHDPESLLKKIIQLNEELTLENKVVTEENKQLKEIIQIKEKEINHLKCSYQKSAYQKFRLTQSSRSGSESESKGNQGNSS